MYHKGGTKKSKNIRNTRVKKLREKLYVLIRNASSHEKFCCIEHDIINCTSYKYSLQHAVFKPEKIVVDLFRAVSVILYKRGVQRDRQLFCQSADGLSRV